MKGFAKYCHEWCHFFTALLPTDQWPSLMRFVISKKTSYLRRSDVIQQKREKLKRHLLLLEFYLMSDNKSKALKAIAESQQFTYQRARQLMYKTVNDIARIYPDFEQTDITQVKRNEWDESHG